MRLLVKEVGCGVIVQFVWVVFGVEDQLFLMLCFLFLLCLVYVLG